MKCVKCGKTFSSHTDGPEICWDCYMKDINDYLANKPHVSNVSNCDIPMPHGIGQQGWICPVCGRGVAPWVDSCPCQSDWEITYGTSINTDEIKSVQDYYKQWAETKHDLEINGKI